MNNEIKDDCFAFVDENICNALNKRKCLNCAFYKTREKFNADVEKSQKRLKALGIGN